MNQKESILIVDDDESTRRSLRLIFGKKGYETEIAGTAQEALEKIKKRSFNVTLIDIRLPDMEGTVLLGKLKKVHPEMVCIVITGYASIENTIMAIKLGSNGYFVKPLVMEEVIYRLEEVLDKQRLEGKLKESEEKYRTLYESSKEGIDFCDMEGNILDANQAFLDMLGYSIEEIKRLTYQKITPKKWHKITTDIIKNQTMVRGYSKEYEKEYIKKDGTLLPITVRSWLIKDKQGRPIGTWAIVRDITERKKAEEEQELHAAMMKNVPEGVFLVGLDDLRIKWTNERFARMFGYDPGEMVGKRVDILNAPTERTPTETRKSIVDILKETGEWHGEVKNIKRDGTHFWGYANVSLFHHPEYGKIMVSVHTDISERKQAEETLQRYKHIVSSSTDMLALLDMQFTYLAANKAYVEAFKLTPKQLIGNTPAKVFGEEYFNTAIKPNAERCLGGEEVNHQNWIDFPAYGRRYMDVNYYPYYSKDKKVIGFVVNGRDITERKKAEEEQELHATMMKNVPEGVYLVGLDDLRIKWTNERFSRMFGYDLGEMIGKRVDILNAPTERTPTETRISIVDILKKTGEWHGEVKNIKRDGTHFWCYANVSLFHHPEYGKIMVSVHTDITERKKAEERLKKSMNATIDTMSKIIEARDPYTSGHQHRVCQLAVPLAQELGLSQDKVEGIRITSLIHDIGKIGIPTEVLSKPTSLTDIEFSLIKDHSQKGHDILKSIDFAYPIAKIVLQHHERLDGTGYPNKLKGDEIILEAKIIGVADVVEAMSSHRPYRPALGIDAALEEISKNKDILYDPEVVNACLKLFKEKGFKFK